MTDEVVEKVIKIVRDHDRNISGSGNSLVDERAAAFLRTKIATALVATPLVKMREALEEAAAFIRGEIQGPVLAKIDAVLSSNLGHEEPRS